MPGVVNTIEVRNVSCAKTLAQWNALQTVPLRGEICLEYKNNGTDINPDLEFKMKLGDGVHLYSALTYFPVTSDIIAIIADWVEDNLDVSAFAMAEFDATNKKIKVKGVKEVDGKISADSTNALEMQFVNGSKINITFNATGKTITVAHATQTITTDTAQTLDFGDSFFVPTAYDEHGHVTNKKQLTLPSNPVSANTVTADGTLTSNQILLGDGNKKAKASGKTITTSEPTANSDDTTVPTSKAVKDAIDTNIQGIEAGRRLTKSGNGSAITIDHDQQTRTNTDVTTQPSAIVTEVVSDDDGTGHVKEVKSIDPDKLTVGLAKDLDAPVETKNPNQFTFRETGDPVNIGEDVARVDVIEGNTIVWNQLIPSTAISTRTVNGVTITNNGDGSYTCNGTSDTQIQLPLATNMVSGHIYYVTGGADGGGSSTYRINSYNVGVNNSSQRICFKSTYTGISYPQIQIFSGVTLNNAVFRPVFIDLTKMFGSDFAIEKALLGLTTEVAWDNLTEDQLALAATNFEKLFPNSYYPYCEGRLVNLGGYGVKWNQLVQNGNFSDTSNWTTTRATLSVSNNVASLYAASNGDNYASHNVSMVIGHKYAFMGDSYSPNTNKAVFYVFYGSSSDFADIRTSQANTWEHKTRLFTCSTNQYNFIRLQNETADTTNQYKNIQLIDLTEMFGPGSEPTLEEFEAMFPNDYYEYDAGTEMNIFDAIGDKKLGIESIGFNLWDEEWEEGAYYTWNATGDGEKYPSNGYLRCKNFIPVVGGKTYYIKEAKNLSVRMSFYDENKNYLGYPSCLSRFNTTFPAPTGAYYMAFYLDGNQSYNTFVPGDVCINIHCDRDGEYEPYKKDTLDLDWVREIEYTPDGSSTPEKLFPYGLLSAGSVHDEVTETKAIKRVGAVDLGELTGWSYSQYTSGQYYFTCPLNNSYGDFYNINTKNTKYTDSNWSYVFSNGIDKCLFTHGINGNVCVTDSSIDESVISGTPGTSSATIPMYSGILLYYELAKPIEIPLDETHIMSYAVDDKGTETLLPINPSEATPITAPFAGSIAYQSNFKEAVRDLIGRVNSYRNPVKGNNNTQQVEGKLAEYDSDHTVKSSLFSPSNATIVADQDGNEYILPSVTALVAYVQNILSSALEYKGAVASWSALPSSGQKKGDLYIFSAADTSHTPPIGIGDFAIWNGSSWDLIQGTVTVTNSAPTLVMNGQTYTIGTVEGVSLTLTTPNLQMSDPTASGSGLEFIATTSQTNGQVSATKKTVQDGTTGQKGVVKLTEAYDGTNSALAVTGKGVKAAIDTLNASEVAPAGDEHITSISESGGKIVVQKGKIQSATMNQKGIVQIESDIHYSESADKVPSAGQTWREFSKRNVSAVPVAPVPTPPAYTDFYASYQLEQSSSPDFTVTNKNFAEAYAASMGGYLFYVKNGVVYAAKLKASDWAKFADGTTVTSEVRDATETMIHVPTCNFKASGTTMKFGGLNPMLGGKQFKSPRWVGAYQMDADGHSRPGVGSGHNKTMSQFWDLAQDIHSGFGLANYEFHNLINALYQALNGNLNSEYVLSNGNSRSSANWDKYRDLEHGYSDTIGDGSGCVRAVDASSTTRYVTRLCGFEDLFGKLWEFRSGIRFYMNNGVRYAVVYDGNQVSNTAEGRIISGVLDSAGGQYTTAMELGEHWDMLPKAVGGSSTTYYCDSYWASTGGQLLIVGSDAYHGSLCGLSYSCSDASFSASADDIGARLAFYSEPIILSGAELVALMA